MHGGRLRAVAVSDGAQSVSREGGVNNKQREIEALMLFRGALDSLERLEATLKRMNGYSPWWLSNIPRSFLDGLTLAQKISQIDEEIRKLSKC